MEKGKYLELIKEKECLLDCVYKNNKNNSNDWLDNYALCDNFLKKFLYYRFNFNDGIDIDSCKYVMPVYVTLCNNIFTDFQFEREKRTGKQKQYEIKVSKDEEIFYLRGDTAINAMSAIQQLFAYISKQAIRKPSKRNCDNEGFRVQYKKYLDIVQKDYKEIFVLLNEHVRLCYSIGNFYPLVHLYRRGALNNCKDLYKLKGYGVYFDDVMSEWLKEMRDSICGNKKCIIKANRNKLDSVYAFWLKEYRNIGENEGKNGWRIYVEENAFEPFMGINNEPITFWEVNKEAFLDQFSMYLERINVALKERKKCIEEKIVVANLSRCANLFAE